MSESAPRVSVVIPVYNAEETLGRCLASMAQEGLEGVEVIVVDDGSTDASPEIAKRFAEVRFVQQANAGPSVARNRGLGLARGALVAFTDSDCIAAPDWLEKLAAHLDDPAVLAVGGSQHCPDDATEFMQDVHGVLSMMGFLGGYTKSAETVQTTGHNPSCNSLYRREQLRELGGFRAGMFPGEDVDLDHRLEHRHPGGRILYDPAAKVWHYRPKAMAGWRRMMRRYGYSSGHNVRLHGVFRALHLIPWALIAGTGGWVVLVILAPPVGLGLACAAATAGAGFVLLNTPGLSWRRRVRRARMLSTMLPDFVRGYFEALAKERRQPSTQGF